MQLFKGSYFSVDAVDAAAFSVEDICDRIGYRERYNARIYKLCFACFQCR